MWPVRQLASLETDEALASTRMVGVPREKDFALFQAGNLVFYLFIFKVVELMKQQFSFTLSMYS